jgi:sortase A
MKDRRCVDDLTIEELERVLIIKKRQARQERLQRLAKEGRLAEAGPGLPGESEPVTPPPATPSSSHTDIRGRFHAAEVRPLGAAPAKAKKESQSRLWRGINFSWIRDTTLLLVEVAALAGLIFVIIGSLETVQELNQEVSMAREIAHATPTPTPFINFTRLPGGHTPPTSPGGAIPEHLQGLVQPGPAVVIPTPGPQSPTRLVIPALNVDVPVLEGIDWETLKKGAGHLPGSANPGERGNVYIAGHNDIYGEIFRYLDRLKVGDDVVIYAGDKPYYYKVKATRVVEPTEVSIMFPTTEPIATLQTCYPYLVDTHRLAVIAELVQ